MYSNAGTTISTFGWAYVNANGIMHFQDNYKTVHPWKIAFEFMFDVYTHRGSINKSEHLTVFANTTSKKRGISKHGTRVGIQQNWQLNLSFSAYKSTISCR